MITLTDFQFFDYYASFKAEGFEICLEFLFYGIAVALYDDRQSLLTPKVVVGSDGRDLDTLLHLSLVEAQRLWYERKSYVATFQD